MIPPNLHFLNPNPTIAFEELQVRVPQCPEPWPDAPGPAIAGVNSFGFGGTNAHLVIMEYRGGIAGGTQTARKASAPPCLLPLSARTPEALHTLVRSYREFLRRDDGDRHVAISDLCYTASVRRMRFDHRLSLVVHSREELPERLDAVSAGEKRAGMFTARRIPGHPPKLVFVCSGQGPQWWGMGRELLEHEPGFRESIAACDRLLRPYADWSLRAE